MSQNDIFRKTGPDYRNYNRPTIHEKIAIQHLIENARIVCDKFAVTHDQPICISAKENACEAIKSTLSTNVKSPDEIIELLGKDVLDFLSCKAL